MVGTTLHSLLIQSTNFWNHKREGLHLKWWYGNSTASCSFEWVYPRSMRSKRWTSWWRKCYKKTALICEKVFWQYKSSPQLFSSTWCIISWCYIQNLCIQCQVMGLKKIPDSSTSYNACSCQLWLSCITICLCTHNNAEVVLTWRKFLCHSVCTTQTDKTSMKPWWNWTLSINFMVGTTMHFLSTQMTSSIYIFLEWQTWRPSASSGAMATPVLHAVCFLPGACGVKDEPIDIGNVAWILHWYVKRVSGNTKAVHRTSTLLYIISSRYMQNKRV